MCRSGGSGSAKTPCAKKSYRQLDFIFECCTIEVGGGRMMQRFVMTTIVCVGWIMAAGCGEDKPGTPGYPDGGPHDVRDIDGDNGDGGPDNLDTLVPCDLHTDVLDVSSYNQDLVMGVGLAGAEDTVWVFHYAKVSLFQGFKLRNYTPDGQSTEDTELRDKQDIDSLSYPNSPAVAVGPGSDRMVAYSAQSGGTKAFHLLRQNGAWPPLPTDSSPGVSPQPFSPGSNVSHVEVSRLPSSHISDPYDSADITYVAAWRSALGSLYFDTIQRGLPQSSAGHTVISEMSSPVWNLSQGGSAPVLVYAVQNGDNVDLKLRKIDPVTGAIGTEQGIFANRNIFDVAATRVREDSTLVAWTQIVANARREVHLIAAYDNGSFGTERIVETGADPSEGIALTPLGDFAVLAYRGGPSTDREQRVTMLKGDASFAFEGEGLEYFIVADLGDRTELDVGSPSLATSDDNNIVALAWSEADGVGGRTRLALLRCTD